MLSPASEDDVITNQLVSCEVNQLREGEGPQQRNTRSRNVNTPVETVSCVERRIRSEVQSEPVRKRPMDAVGAESALLQRVINRRYTFAWGTALPGASSEARAMTL